MSNWRVLKSRHPQAANAVGGGEKEDDGLQAVGGREWVLSGLRLVEVPSPPNFPRFAPPFEGGTRGA